eukprot:scaffold517_cov255-Pinguiococcus_pyrenoidosus.AAC.14
MRPMAVERRTRSFSVALSSCRLGSVTSNSLLCHAASHANFSRQYAASSRPGVNVASCNILGTSLFNTLPWKRCFRPTGVTARLLMSASVYSFTCALSCSANLRMASNTPSANMRCSPEDREYEYSCCATRMMAALVVAWSLGTLAHLLRRSGDLAVPVHSRSEQIHQAFRGRAQVLEHARVLSMCVDATRVNQAVGDGPPAEKVATVLAKDARVAHALSLRRG